MASTPNTASLYESGSSNLDILESIGNDVLAENTPAAQPAAAGTGVADTGASTGSSVDQTAAGVTDVAKPEWFESAPQEYKDLAGQQNISATAKKWLEDTYGKLQTFNNSPIGTPEALTEITELFPGGLDDMKEAHTAAGQFRTEMEQFHSDDPAQQTELLGNLLQDSPDHFVSMLSAGAALLKQTLRDDYTSFATNLAHEHLDSITDGKFAPFFDGILKMAQEYNGLLDTNPEGAAKLASKLAGAGLEIANWWTGAKNKLGYGEKQVTGAPSATGGRAPVVSSAGRQDDREVAIAQRESNLWSANYMIKHDQAINPTINQVMSKELAARNMTDLPKLWQQRVTDYVANQVKANLSQDKTFLALENRVYRRGAAGDARKWDNSDQAARTLLAAAQQRAAKLVPQLVTRALNDIATMRPAAPAKSQPGAGTRTSATSPAGGQGGGGNWEQDLKDGKTTSLDVIQRIAGV